MTTTRAMSISFRKRKYSLVLVAMCFNNALQLKTTCVSAAMKKSSALMLCALMRKCSVTPGYLSALMKWSGTPETGRRMNEKNRNIEVSARRFIACFIGFSV